MFVEEEFNQIRPFRCESYARGSDQEDGLRRAAEAARIVQMKDVSHAC